MGAGASAQQAAPFASIEEALAAGKTQEEIDTWQTTQGETKNPEDTAAAEAEAEEKTAAKATSEPEGTANVTNSPSFYTHKLPLPTDKYLIDTKPFRRSARGCREFRRLNPFLHHTGPESSRPPCKCNYIKSFASGHRFCDACNKDLGDARYAQEMRLLNIVKQEDSGVSTNEHARRLHGLGIRLSALIAFAYAHDCWDWPTWMIVRDIVKPATKVNRCRYGELREMKGCFGPATVFMSHC